MKTADISTCMGRILAISLCLLSASQKTRAGLEFGVPTKLGPTVDGLGQAANGVSVASDGLSLNLHSSRAPGMSSNTGIWRPVRSSMRDEQGAVKVGLDAGWPFTSVGQVVFNTTAAGVLIANIHVDKDHLAPNTTFKATLLVWDSDHVLLGQTDGDLESQNKGQGNTQLRLYVSTNVETLQAKVRILNPTPFGWMDTPWFTNVPVK